MRNLVMILIVGSCALFWAGAEGARADTSLSCGTTSCKYNEEFKASQKKKFHGHCDGTNTKMTASNSQMICHKASGLTCTQALLVNANKSDTYWSCHCTNWNTKKHSTTIDIKCPAPS